MASKNPEEEEFLVFGYHCKLFRDDEKAMFIDSGRHLISWMGQESLKVDRYDVRATLSDLSQYEAPPGGYDWFQCLTAEERKIEEMCDEERYMALYKDLEEEAADQEEEMKRLKSALGESYSEVKFSYDEDKSKQVEEAVEEESMEAAMETDEPFVAPHELHISSDLAVPDTMKQYHVIVKTAKFLATQDPQMEIVLRARQAGNTAFDFLTYGNILNPFYKYLLRVIKSGRFNPDTATTAVKKKEEEVHEETSDDDDDDGGYLHPSLFSRQTVNPTPPVPSLPSTSATPSGSGFPQAPSVRKDNPYANLVSRIQTQNLYYQPMFQHQAALQQQQQTYSLLTAPPPPPPPPSTIPPPPSPPAQILAELEAEPEPEVRPPPEVEAVINKTAMYVAKNGVGFESTITSRGDERFSFLKPDDPFHAYYEQRKRFYAGDDQIEPKPGQGLANGSSSPASTSVKKSEEGTKGGTLKFSLKKKKEERKLLDPKFAVDEDSTEEVENEAELLKKEDKAAGSQDEDSVLGFDDIMDVPMPESLEKTAAEFVDDLNFTDELLAMKRKREEVKSTKKAESNNMMKQIQLDRKRKVAEFIAKLQKKDNTGTSNLRPGQKLSQPAPVPEISRTFEAKVTDNPEQLAAFKDEPIFDIELKTDPIKPRSSTDMKPEADLHIIGSNVTADSISAKPIRGNSPAEDDVEIVDSDNSVEVLQKDDSSSDSEPSKTRTEVMERFMTYDRDKKSRLESKAKKEVKVPSEEGERMSSSSESSLKVEKSPRKRERSRRKRKDEEEVESGEVKTDDEEDRRKRRRRERDRSVSDEDENRRRRHHRHHRSHTRHSSKLKRRRHSSGGRRHRRHHRHRDQPERERDRRKHRGRRRDDDDDDEEEEEIEEVEEVRGRGKGEAKKRRSRKSTDEESESSSEEESEDWVPSANNAVVDSD